MPDLQFSPTYRVSPNAVHENFDDEVVIINMMSGCYFSLNETALQVWALLERGNSLESVIAALQQKFRDSDDAIKTTVKTLVGELEREDLIVPLAQAPLKQSETEAVSDAAPAVFVAPTISKFTDMQELLLLDPIHEVDELGWPHAKAADDGVEATVESEDSRG